MGVPETSRWRRPVSTAAGPRIRRVSTAMEASTAAREILYVTGRDVDRATVARRLGLDDRATASVRTARSWRDRLAAGRVDCVLCGADIVREECLDLLGSVRAEFPSVPVLVFTGDRGEAFVEEVLEAGAGDVVQSTLTETPGLLVRRRIERLVEGWRDPARGPGTGERDGMLRQISENISDVVWVTSPAKDEVEFVSGAYESVYGRPPEELETNPTAFLDVVYPADRERVREALAAQRADPDAYDETYRVVHPDGAVRWVHDRSFGVYEDGSLERIVGIARDITDRKERERELTRLKEEYEVIFGNVGEAVFLVDVDGGTFRYVRYSPDRHGWTGLTPEEVEGRTPREVLGGETGAGVVENYRACLDRGEPIRYEETVDLPGGSRTWRTTLAPVVVDGETAQIVGISRDVTEEKRCKEKIEKQRDDLAQLARLNAVIRDVDQALVGARTREEIEQVVCERLTDAGRYRFALALRVEGEDRLVPAASTDAGEAFAEAVFPIEDATPESSPGLRALETGEVQVVQSVRTHPDAERWRAASLEAGLESFVTVPVGYEETTYGVIGVYADEQGAFGERELRVFEELGETVGYAIAAAQRRERERTLTSLYEATRALLGTESQTGVCDVVVDVAADVLDLSGVGIFLFDDEANELRPESATDELIEFYGDSTMFGPGRDDSEAWHSYATGEVRFFDDIRDSERVANPETDARSSLVLPLGEHGVFVAADATVGAFDEGKRQLVGLLAATAETALDRVAGEARARERDRALADRTRRLERLAAVVDLVRDAQRSVVRARSREEIERAVCERLAETDPVTFAWVGAVTPDGEAVVPRAWAGGAGEYLDEVSLSLSGEEPATQATAGTSVVAVPNVTDHLRDGAWARAATDCGYQSVVAIPLASGGTTRGVLAVYADSPDAFDDTTTDALHALGEVVAHAMAATETRQGLLADRVTELELAVPDPGTFLDEVADHVGGSVRYLEYIPEADGRGRILFALEGTPVEEVLALETAFVGVDSLGHVRTDGDVDVFEATVTERPVAVTLLDCGAVPVEVRAHPGETGAVVAVLPTVDVRTVVDRVRSTYPGTELRSRRERSRRARSERDIRGAFESELTDRQREVLELAYESGYFRSPRDTSGVELADRLDISQPTLTHHLREGQRRLFDALLGDDSR